MTAYVKCDDCYYCFEIDPQPYYEYHRMCCSPHMKDVLAYDTSGHQNSLERCNETRAFKFACTPQARWFIADGSDPVTRQKGKDWPNDPPIPKP